MGDQATWLGKYPILDATHADDLEMRAAINEHHHHMPRHEAEEKAHKDYRRDQILDAAAHHYAGMIASHAVGKRDEATKHGVQYALALKQIGHGDIVNPPEEVLERVKTTPSDKIGNFKGHDADAYTQPPETDKEKEQKLKKSETATIAVEHAAGHKLGMRVLKGGSMCGNCSYANDDGKSCSNDLFQKFNGGSELPAPADEYCCDEWHPKVIG